MSPICRPARPAYRRATEIDDAAAEIANARSRGGAARPWRGRVLIQRNDGRHIRHEIARPGGIAAPGMRRDHHDPGEKP